MQSIATDKTAFDKPYDPISSSGMLRHAVDTEANFNDMLNGEQPFDRMLFTDPTELAITGGVLAATSLAVHTVAAQSGTSDDLDTIPAVNNTFLFLKAKATHSIALKHGTGNISSSGGIDVLLSGNRIALLICQGSQWGIVGTNRPKINIAATVDPKSSDDALAGYSVGSLWINTTLDRAWECMDSSSGAAIWKLISPYKNYYWTRAGGGNECYDWGITHLTVSSGIAAASVIDSDGTWLQLQTTATPGNSAHIIQNTSFASVRPAYSPIMESLVKTDSDITFTRYWIGMFSALPTNVDTLAAGTKGIGFRFSADAGDTGWVPVINDGTNQTTGTAIGTVQASTPYKLKIRVDANLTTAYFSVNDGAEQVLSANFPAIATDMDSVLSCRTTTGAPRIQRFGRMQVGW
jgi:hypothetical protein